MNNKYFFLRHGEAISNKKRLISSWPEKFNNHLTIKGRKQIKKAAKELKKKKIDLIISSDLLRTRQTSEIIKKELKINISYDKRLREIGFGVFNGDQINSLLGFYKSEEERFKKRIPNGESYNDVIKRVYSLFRETEKKYSNKNILLISHEGPFTLLEGKIRGLSNPEILRKYPDEKRIKKGEWRVLKTK